MSSISCASGLYLKKDLATAFGFQRPGVGHTPFLFVHFPGVQTARVPSPRLAVRSAVIDRLEIAFGVPVPDGHSTRQLLGQIQAHTQVKESRPD